MRAPFIVFTIALFAPCPAPAQPVDAVVVVRVETRGLHASMVDAEVVRPLADVIRAAAGFTVEGTVATRDEALLLVRTPAGKEGLEPLMGMRLPELVTSAPQQAPLEGGTAARTRTLVDVDVGKLSALGLAFAHLQGCVEWAVRPRSLFTGAAPPKNCEPPPSWGTAGLPKLGLGKGTLRTVLLSDVATVRTEDAPKKGLADASAMLEVHADGMPVLLERLAHLESLLRRDASAPSVTVLPRRQAFPDVQMDPKRAEELGVTLEGLRGALGEALGLERTVSQEPLVVVRLRPWPEDRLSQVRVPARKGTVTVADVARIVRDEAPSVVLRRGDGALVGYVLVQGGSPSAVTSATEAGGRHVRLLDPRALSEPERRLLSLFVRQVR